MRKFFLKSVALICSVAILFYGLTFALIFPSKGQVFKEHYQKGYVIQYRAAEREREKKILSIGASHVAFNIDTNRLQEITGMPAYNLGINGGMGYHVVLEHALDLVKEGDVVLYPYWGFTKDDYGMGLIWLSLEGEPDLLWKFIKKHPQMALSSIGQFGLKKLYESTFGHFAPTGMFSEECYQARWFDERGNYIFERNTQTLTPEEMYLGYQVSYDVQGVTDDFYSTMSAFITACRAKGAEVYFTFHSVMEKSLATSFEQAEVLRHTIEDKLSVKFLNSCEEVTYPYEYYYNSSTHLTSAAMLQYTTTVGNALLPYLN